MNLNDLKEHTIFITGSAKRIGRQIALSLAEYKPRLILHYHRSEKEIEELLEIVQQYNISSFKIQCDLTNYDAVKDLVKKLKSEKISILINNASIFPNFDFFENYSLEQSQQIFFINLIIPLYLIRELIDLSRKGLVINFIDASLQQIRPDHFTYRLSKYALLMATKILAKELSPNIRVNGISPGAILPPLQIDENNNVITISNNEEIEKFYKNSIERNPLKIQGDIQYIIQTLRYIIENDFLNGVIIPVDGGQYI